MELDTFAFGKLNGDVDGGDVLDDRGIDLAPVLELSDPIDGVEMR